MSLQAGGRWCDEKPVLAERYKTRLCDKYMETGGYCPYGIRCMFAHGHHELRTTEDNLRDGLVTESSIRRFRERYYLDSSSCNSFSYSSFCSPLAHLPPPPPYPSASNGRREKDCHCSSGVRLSLGLPPSYDETVEEYRHKPYQTVLDEEDAQSRASETSWEESESTESMFFPKGTLSCHLSTGGSIEGCKNEVNNLLNEVAVM